MRLARRGKSFVTAVRSTFLEAERVPARIAAF
jgi:hypothetical protein